MNVTKEIDMVKFKREVIFIIYMLFASVVFAETPDVTATGDTITARHRYTMGDNDSKSDATNLCFLEAKRKAIEYAGVYVESSNEITQTNASSNAKSNMKSIAKALVSAEMISSGIGFENGRLFVDCVVNAKVNLNTVKQDVVKIASDPAAKKHIEQQQIALKKLEEEITIIQTQLKSASSQQAISLRQERTVIFKNIDKLQQMKLEITSYIESKGKETSNLISKGMNFSEVLSLLGQPRVKIIYKYEKGDQAWNYGTHWVNFHQNIVHSVDSYARVMSDYPFDSIMTKGLR